MAGVIPVHPDGKEDPEEEKSQRGTSVVAANPKTTERDSSWSKASKSTLPRPGAGASLARDRWGTTRGQLLLKGRVSMVRGKPLNEENLDVAAGRNKPAKRGAE